MSICSSVWWCYCGCQYYSLMDKTWQTAEWMHLQCSDATDHHCTDKLIHGNCCITTDELWSVLFMDKGSVMALLKSLAVLTSTDWVPWLLTDAHRQGEQLPLICAPIWQGSLGFRLQTAMGDKTWVHHFEPEPRSNWLNGAIWHPQRRNSTCAICCKNR